MNKFVVKLGCSVSVACLLSIATPAFAQETDWSGFYIGGSAGGASLGARYSSENSTDSGTIMGVHAGYNFQSANIVFGVEADYTLANMYLCERDCDGDRNWVSVDTMSSIRGRVGMTFGNILVFGTAGIGTVAGIQVSSTSGDDGTFSGSGITVVSAGVDWALTDSSSIRIEATSYLVDGLRLDQGTGHSVRPYTNLNMVSVGFSTHF